MAEDYRPDNRVTYNAAEEIKDNIVNYFKVASICMAKLDFYNWYKALEAVFVEANFKFKQKEVDELNEIWKKINPHSAKAYPLLKDYHIKIRKICYDHDFFTPPKTNPGEAVYG